MLKLLCPQWVFDNYEAVTPEFLKEHGVKLLLSDLDFTLAPKSQSKPDESLTLLDRRAEGSGHRVCDFVEQPQSRARGKVLQAA